LIQIRCLVTRKNKQTNQPRNKQQQKKIKQESVQGKRKRVEPSSLEVRSAVAGGNGCICGAVAEL